MVKAHKLSRKATYSFHKRCVLFYFDETSCFFFQRCFCTALNGSGGRSGADGGAELMKRVEWREGARRAAHAPRELRGGGVVLAHYRQQCPVWGGFSDGADGEGSWGQLGGRVRAAW